VSEVDPDSPEDPGRVMGADFLVRGESEPGPGGLSRVEHVEARGGPAFLILSGRGRPGESCPDSIVPLRRLPGYSERDRQETTIRVPVPTCQASRAGMVEIPAGRFVFGGRGEPPCARPDLYPESIQTLPAFAMDRTEVNNAAFRVFASLGDSTGIAMPTYASSDELQDADEPDRPVAGISWSDARAYCRYLGKDLPTTEQWQKASRGGMTLAGGQPNPWPRRNLPWGPVVEPAPANLRDTGPLGPAPVGSSAEDVSPYGVVDLAGNIQEWTLTASASHGFRVVRGGNWDETSSADLIDYMAIVNERPARGTTFALGVRCVVGAPGRAR
jgi:formylglycine-generating enzyme required for sulfatase activity